MELQLDSVALALLVAGLMPVICAGIAKWGATDYDNHYPRDWLAKLDGFKARAHAAQQNCFEAFPFFAAGVIFAAMGGLEESWLVFLSWSFVLARVAYIACYLSDRATWRSICWGLGFLATVSLYGVCIF